MCQHSSVCSSGPAGKEGEPGGLQYFVKEENKRSQLVPFSLSFVEQRGQAFTALSSKWKLIS